MIFKCAICHRTPAQGAALRKIGPRAYLCKGGHGPETVAQRAEDARRARLYRAPNGPFVNLVKWGEHAK